jgi:hypothetical protein
MVEIFDNLISSEQLAWFRDDFAKMIDVDPVMRPYDPADAKRIYGVDDCSVLDQRHIVQVGTEAYTTMINILSPVIPIGTFFYMAYQRQFLPHQLHVDEVYEHTNLAYAKSAVIPLHDNPDNIFKTIIWNKVFLTNGILNNFFKEYIADSSKFPVVSDVSATQDVDHCWGSPSIVNVMPLDGVYDYRLGSVGVFDRIHVHCSSNWRKYNQIDYKDIIILHIG